MKALIFDRYLDTLGGGERYSLEFAQAAKKLGYAVELAWKNPADVTAARNKFGLELTGINLNHQAYDLFFAKSGLLDRLLFTKNYDLVFWVSDGSLPVLFSKKVFVHFQVPFSKIGGQPFINGLKSILYNRVLYNSRFTRGVIEKQIPLSKGDVLYPPVDVDNFKPGAKENIILSTARFDSPSHAKRQDILIKAFARLYRFNKDYKLLLVGGVKGSGGKNYLNTLREGIKDLPIQIIANPDFTKLTTLYSTARFFWHAAGYGINEKINPEKVEHFGITTVEAMSAGCIPVVINRGGQREIITPDTGYLCQNVKDIVAQTLHLIADPSLAKKIAHNARRRATDFSVAKFRQNIQSIITQ